MAKKTSIGSVIREFVSEENRNYKVQIGSTIASSLAGLVTGAVIASITWYTVFKYIMDTLIITQ
jgi:hypothetical protein